MRQVKAKERKEWHDLKAKVQAATVLYSNTFLNCPEQVHVCVCVGRGLSARTVVSSEHDAMQ